MDSHPPAAPDPPVEVRRSARRRRTMTAFREGDVIVVAIPAGMSAAEERRCVPGLVQRLLDKERRTRAPRGDAALRARARDLAREYLEPVVGAFPLPHDVTWVTNQNRRWGSCTPATREIRLSHRLQPMPAWVVDYVLLHELAHLVEANHSDRFWRIVSAYPLTERARGYLDGYADARRTGAAPDAGAPGPAFG